MNVRFVRLLLLSGLIAASLASSSQETAFYVSTTGSDSSEGTLDAPFATLSRAQRAARQAVAAGTLPVTVYLRGGVHYLDALLRFWRSMLLRRISPDRK